MKAVSPLLVGCLLLCSASATRPTIPASRTIVVHRAGKPDFVHVFSRPQEILAQQVSPSGNFLLIWHRDYPPIRLTIFRLTDGRQIADFVPGFGGEIRWTLGDKILHLWGYGTDCRSVAVYDITGATLLADSCDDVILTDRGYFVEYPIISPSKPIVKYDVNTGKYTTLVKARSQPPAQVGVEGNKLIVQFDGEAPQRLPLE